MRAEIGAGTVELTARVAESDERERIWYDTTEALMKEFNGVMDKNSPLYLKGALR